MSRIGCIGVFSLVAALASGCEVKGALGVGGSNTTPPPAPPPAQQHETVQAERGNPGTQVGSGGGEQPGYSANCPNPANHCLAEDLIFASDKGYTKNYIYVEPARMTQEPGAGGQAELLAVRDGKTMVTEHFWRTRAANPSELAVGQLVVMLHKRSGNAYRPPEDRDEAQGTRWWLARVVNVMPLDRGHVVVSGGYVVQADALRLIDGDDSPTARLSGQEDAHYLRPEHWIISDRPLPSKGYVYASVGAPIQPPSAQTKNEGHFVDVHTGEITWTGNAWRTRPATKDTVKVGDFVAMVHKRSGDSYRAPQSREESMGTRWWVAKVVDTSELFKGVIGVAGGYKVNLDAARVIQQ